MVNMSKVRNGELTSFHIIRNTNLSSFSSLFLNRLFAMEVESCRSQCLLQRFLRFSIRAGPPTTCVECRLRPADEWPSLDVFLGGKSRFHCSCWLHSQARQLAGRTLQHSSSDVNVTNRKGPFTLFFRPSFVNVDCSTLNVSNTTDRPQHYTTLRKQNRKIFFKRE